VTDTFVFFEEREREGLRDVFADCIFFAHAMKKMYDEHDKITRDRD
jgi:hypothetical protein